jgi:4-amino-4-deoxy-L-arabinose transferase-like glycosyltransferase
LANKNAICVLLGLYLILAIVYSVVTPVMEASDELWHYPMVKYIADHWSLPVQDPERVGPWRQEGSQVPLYYWLGALLTSWIDTSDLNQVRRLNPRVDNGIIREDGNTNLIVHTQAEAWPWRGTVLAIHFIRFLSVAMGVGTVYLTYRLMLELLPERWRLALAAAAITAFNPMFCFISGAVNNDNLAMLLCALAFWLLLRLARRHSQGVVATPESAESRRAWFIDVMVLGFVLGTAVLTKSQSMGLLPLTAATIGYIAWRRRSWWHLLTGGSVTAGLAVLISGWWFVRNAILYDGDWMGIERFIVILGYRVPPASLRQLWGERQGFMMAYWGLFGGVNVPLPGWIYAVLNGAAIASIAGLIIGVGKCAVRWVRARWRPQPSQLLNYALLGMWPLIVVVLWAIWARRTWSSQGRLVFAAISAWSTWMALGLSQLLPRRVSNLVPGGLGVFMLAVTAWAPWGAIAPAYRPPLIPPSVDVVPEHILKADVGGQLRLLGYDIETEIVRPGDVLRFTLYWEAQSNMDRDWQIFCHIIDQGTGLHIATRDRYPGQGLLATSDMQPGVRWSDRYAIEVPKTAYAPGDLILEIGLYDGDERPPIHIKQGDGTVVLNALRFQHVQVEPLPGDIPNPTRVNFEDRMALIGWDVDRRVAAAGDTLSLTLYWECLSSMDRSYTASTQLVAEDLNKAAQLDTYPGGIDTRTWRAGQRIVDRREIAIFEDAAPGGYQLLLGVYGWEADGDVKRLRLIDDAGRVLPGDTFVVGQIRVEP